MKLKALTEVLAHLVQAAATVSFIVLVFVSEGSGDAERRKILDTLIWIKVSNTIEL